MKMLYFMSIIQKREARVIDWVIIIIFWSGQSGKFLQHSYPSHSTSMEIHFPFYQPILPTSLVHSFVFALRRLNAQDSAIDTSKLYVLSMLKYKHSIASAVCLHNDCTITRPSPPIDHHAWFILAISALLPMRTLQSP